MVKNHLLGLDIGTQAVKGVVVTADGEIMARAELERGPVHPKPGWVEMDVERDWWGAGLQVINELLSAKGISSTKIAAIGISGLVPCLGLLDAEGRSLRPAILYSDNRALEEMEWVNKQADLTLNAEAVVPKLVWVKRHQPEIFSRASIVLSAHNYMVYRLTGVRSMDYDTAAIMGGVFDPVTKTWSVDINQYLDLPLSLWPTPSPATGVVGKVTPEAARFTGLTIGTPVIAGSGDTFPTIVGCGAVEPGDAMISIGTTGLLTISNRPLVESAAGPHFDANIGDAAVTWGANVLSAGRLVRWYCDNFALVERTIAARLGGSEFDLLEEEAKQIPPGSEGLIVLPHWLGRRTPISNATLRGAVLGLSPSHNSAHIYRAIMEGFAYNINQSFIELRSGINRVVVTAGGAQSRLWRQIIADVLNTSLEYHPGSSGSLGIAFITGYAVGLIDEFTDIKTRWLSQPQIVEPNPAAVEVYQRLFSIYCEFDEAVEAPFRHMATVMENKAQ